MADLMKGKIAAITGAASGMGRSAAQRFARSGHPVAMLDIQASWSRSLCSGPSGSRTNNGPSNRTGTSKSSGTSGAVTSQSSVGPWASTSWHFVRRTTASRAAASARCSE